MAGAPLPEGYHSVNPYFVVERAERLIEFLTDVFKGIEHGERQLRSDGRINHADVRIGDSIVMLSEARRSTQPGHVSTTHTSITSTRRSKRRSKRGQRRLWILPTNPMAIV